MTAYPSPVSWGRTQIDFCPDAEWDDRLIWDDGDIWNEGGTWVDGAASNVTWVAIPAPTPIEVA